MQILKNQKSIKTFIFLTIFLFTLLIQFNQVNAACPPECGSATNTINLETKIVNPLGDSFSDLPSFITTLVDVALVIGIPLITLAIIYSGFLFVSAQGKAKELETAKKNFTYTIIGAALLLGALVIANAIKDTITSIKA